MPDNPRTSDGVSCEIYYGTGRTRLRLRALNMGQDICVFIEGGDRPHIGAVSLRDATGAFSPPPMTIPGHREDVLAAQCCEMLQQALHTNVFVACGIYLSNITQIEIDEVCANAHTLVRKFIEIAS